MALDAPARGRVPGDAVTVYEAIAVPPFEAGGVKLTVAWPFPGTPDTPIGGDGTVSCTANPHGWLAPVTKLWLGLLPLRDALPIVPLPLFAE